MFLSIDARSSKQTDIDSFLVSNRSNEDRGKKDSNELDFKNLWSNEDIKILWYVQNILHAVKFSNLWSWTNRNYSWYNWWSDTSATWLLTTNTRYTIKICYLSIYLSIYLFFLISFTFNFSNVIFFYMATRENKYNLNQNQSKLSNVATTVYIYIYIRVHINFSHSLISNSSNRSPFKSPSSKW